MSSRACFFFLVTLLQLNFSLNAIAQSRESNVVLLMLDGVRWQEVFSGTDPQLNGNEPSQTIFDNLLGELSQTGVLMGNVNNGEELTVSNGMMISMSAYQSIFGGYNQKCITNTCGRIKVETVGERIVRELNLPKTQVATIASWKAISDAVEHVAGATFTNAGPMALEDGTDDPELARLNQLALAEPPAWKDARADKHTFALSLHYLKKHQPRFMFISLNDSDEWGHKGDYKNYVETLKQYDSWIRELVRTLQEMGEYGESTTLIVTTDHGRGNGVNWNHHGPHLPEAKYIWLYGWRAQGPAAQESLLKPSYAHIDLRPTIEANLGLAPTECAKCGKVIAELAPQKNQ